MATITLPKVITPAVLRAVEMNMQRCFAELERAEQQHACPDSIERLYQAYLTAMTAFREADRRYQERN